MLVTQSMLEAIRTEFATALEAEFNLDHKQQVMALYDRATALAIGKRFMSDDPIRKG